MLEETFCSRGHSVGALFLDGTVCGGGCFVRV
jgi:hypothetical protein